MHPLLDLGPAFGKTIRLDTVKSIASISVAAGYKEYEVRLWTDSGVEVERSRGFKTREEADEVRLEVQEKLTRFVEQVRVAGATAEPHRARERFGGAKALADILEHLGQHKGGLVADDVRNALAEYRKALGV